MKKCYINGIGSVSAQETFTNGFIENLHCDTDSNVLYAKEPDYKSYISRIEIRRMEKGVKMSIAAATKALYEADIKSPDAIITGTGMSCLRSSEKFLKAMINNDELYLTPINFIQSTHNTVAGQIALKFESKGYNFNYVNSSSSFEAALLDAHNLIENNIEENVLVGGVDETNEHTISLYKHINFIKSDEGAPYQILPAKSKGMVMGEGAHFFLLNAKKSSQSFATIDAIEVHNSLAASTLKKAVLAFLKKNNTKIEELDALVLGNNGDVNFDNYYEEIEKALPEAIPLFYKHLSGEYHTSSAFGFGLACSILKEQQIPSLVNKKNKTGEAFNTILLYNQYRGKDHSFILLRKA